MNGVLAQGARPDQEPGRSFKAGKGEPAENRSGRSRFDYLSCQESLANPACINGIEGGAAAFLDTILQKVVADRSQIELFHQLVQIILGKRLIQAPERVIRPGHVSQYS